eukprot:gb/GFBE01059186.1/.p1 GENE.gb/GFBE01059186.1/~~gb/GFBE01059186.1/.p1  ORF type:complete len:347 (+),score=83.04 gb/GFBE01059186.1/:1-1041(+)
MAAPTAPGDKTLYMFMLVMLLTGTVNMLLLKFQNMQQAPMSPGGPPVPFQHPWLQTALMMMGEVCCLPLFVCINRGEDARAVQSAPKLIFLVPCCCDLLAMALFCTGLEHIAVSVAQMCRGTIVVFVCLMSLAFLGRQQQSYQRFGVGLVTSGILMVSMSAMMADKGGHPGNLLTGIALCIFAQVFQASMFVYEEKIMSQYPVEPLQVVGMEGLFGIGICAILFTAMHTLGHIDAIGAYNQIASSPVLLLSIVSQMAFTAVFNVCGANITKRSSAVARTTIKISSTILIWLVELAAGWNTFNGLQLLGFLTVAAGTLIYNRIVVLQQFEPSDEQQPLAESSSARKV